MKAIVRPTIDIHRHPGIRSVRLRRWNGKTEGGHGVDLYVVGFCLYGQARVSADQGVLELEVHVTPRGSIYPYRGKGPSCRRWEGETPEGAQVELDVAFFRVPMSQVPGFEEEFREAFQGNVLEELPDLGPPFQTYGLRQILA